VSREPAPAVCTAMRQLYLMLEADPGDFLNRDAYQFRAHDCAT